MNLLGSWLNTTELLRQTVLKWCNRDSVQDRSYHPPSSNHLNSAQEVVAVALRQTSLVLLDELLASVRVSEPKGISFGFRSLPAHAWRRKSSWSKGQGWENWTPWFQSVWQSISSHWREILSKNGYWNVARISLCGYPHVHPLDLHFYLRQQDGHKCSALFTWTVTYISDRHLKHFNRYQQAVHFPFFCLCKRAHY